MGHVYLSRPEVTFTVEAAPEQLAIKGNCSAIDAKTDAKTERWIRKQLNGGNEWAWCVVKVTATLGEFEGTAYLGACSYASREDFTQQGDGYYGDMCDEALTELDEAMSAALDSYTDEVLIGELKRRGVIA